MSVTGKQTVGSRSILLVDDQPAFRGLARELLANHPGITIVGEAGTGEEALELLEVLQPQVAIVDVQLPGMNGFETAWRMLSAAPGLQVIVISGWDFEYAPLARSVGAVAFLPKKNFSAEAILAVLS